MFQYLIKLSFVFLSVDASAAGEGQLEISINEGEVPNHVQVSLELNEIKLCTGIYTRNRS